MIMTVHSSSSSARYSCQILMKLDFLERFWKNAQISNFMKILRMGTELLHADGQAGL